MGLTLDEAVKSKVEEMTGTLEKNLNQPVRITKVHVNIVLEYDTPETNASDSTGNMPCCDIHNYGKPEQGVMAVGVKPRAVQSPPKK